MNTLTTEPMDFDDTGPQHVDDDREIVCGNCKSFVSLPTSGICGVATMIAYSTVSEDTSAVPCAKFRMK